MKIINYIIVAACITALVGCEESVIVEVTLQETNFIIVHAELIGGEIFKGVTITKPLPIDQEYRADEAAIDDIIAYIQIDGAQVIPLHHRINGLYKPLYEMMVTPGKTYELFARVGDRKIYSKTIVPEVPHVNRVILQSDFSFTATIVSQPEIVYGATWVIVADTNEYRADNFYEINEDNSNSLLTVKTQILPESMRNITPRYVRVYAFDRPFLDYFNTRENNQPVDDYFTQGGGPVAWNVYGDGVAGLFIGVTPSELVRPQVN